MLHRLKLPLAIALIYCRISSALIGLGVGLKIGIFIQFSLLSLLILSFTVGLHSTNHGSWRLSDTVSEYSHREEAQIAPDRLREIRAQNRGCKSPIHPRNAARH